MTEYEFPTRDEVMGFGSAHNAAVWTKHRLRLADPSNLDAVLRACQSANQKLSRRQVFEMADTNPEWGVIAAVVWGFPRGSMPGGKWLGLRKLLNRHRSLPRHWPDSGPTRPRQRLQLRG
jgi:hypothetical protein